MYDYRQKILNEIEAERGLLDAVILAPYTYQIGASVSSLTRHQQDSAVYITNGEEKIAVIEFTSQELFWGDDEVRLMEDAKAAGYSYGLMYCADWHEILIKDLRETKAESSRIVPLASLKDLEFVLRENESEGPTQLDWKSALQDVIAKYKHDLTEREIIERLQTFQVEYNEVTKQCHISKSEDEREFFKSFFIPYKEDEICRYTTYETLERILRDKKQSVCSIVCMNDKSECYYADAYLAKRNKAKFGKKVEVDYKKVNKCMISSCTHIRLADKLSLWRMYADDGKGVCLKFKINKDLLKNKGFHLFCVDYAYDEKGKHWRLDLLAHFRQMKIRGYTFDFEEWHIWRHFFKPSHYDDEHEVRLLYFNEDTDKFKWIKTGDSQILAPVVEFEIKEDNNEFPLELSEIILGPKFPEAETNAEQIRYFKELQKIKENGDCPVTLSKIKGYR